MPRFRVTRTSQRTEIAFDDGGMNLLSSDALRELRDVLPDPAESTMLVFRSAQPRLFAAGADMAEMQRFTAADAYAFAQLGQEVFASIERLPCLTVASIDGDCFGGALDLILAFDIRLATPRSRFAHPGARIGIVTGFGGTSRWRKVLTRPAANQLFLANRVLSASEALELGLVDRVAESHDEEIARMSSLDPAATQLVKELARGTELSRIELLRLAQNFGGR
ncbi:MAG: enoyl-CoA hydratase/isomerase family protein [Acidobacteriota bacterium]|nr:enoyl-CoA hydratase/isomerase family protein [Acidobacteriota bacterium]